MKSDKDIRRDVEAELDWDPRVDSRNIGVAVKEGIVTLSGAVESYPARWSSEEAAQRVAGVRAIANEIEVNLVAGGERTDTDIAQGAVHALSLNTLVPADGIHVVVRDGSITLSGDVEYWYQKISAERIVGQLRGLKGVINAIAVKPRQPSVNVADVKKKIEAAFQRRAHFDAQRVKVEIADGTVTLAGDVPTWPERDAAEYAAWAAPGVTRIDNKIGIRP